MSDMSQMNMMAATVEDRVIYRQDLYAMLGVTSETLRRWLRDGKLPPPDVAITQRTVGWRLSTLQAAGIRLL
ncbi:helix-turn-helix transcriptional regulator [Pseudoduganella sp. RAF53_2]|uniref:helix-turn-helix transcriptional regulator n=1 Tax=unclassified Pseudoduganella TaxID=2637179 RepID=UPI003F9D01E4